MRPAELTPGQVRLLNRFSEVGGAVDFVLLDAQAPPNFDAHHDAVRVAMGEIQRRADEYAEHTARKHDIPKSRIFQVAIDPAAGARLVPRKITWLEFLGPRYDFERNGLIVRGKGKFLNDFFFFSDPARHENIVSPAAIDQGIGAGFAYAFSSPPYGLRMPPEEVGTLFDKFLRFVLCGSSESLIYEWPTDWSNYFDAGKEWWGAFLWSLSNPGSNQIVVMAASTTD